MRKSSPAFLRMLLGLFLGADISGFMLLGLDEALYAAGPRENRCHLPLHGGMGRFDIVSHPPMKRIDNIPGGVVYLGRLVATRHPSILLQRNAGTNAVMHNTVPSLDCCGMRSRPSYSLEFTFESQLEHGHQRGLTLAQPRWSFPELHLLNKSGSDP